MTPVRAADQTPFLIALFLLTSTLLIAVEMILSGNLPMTIAAVRVSAVTIALTGTACLVGRFTASAPIGLLAVTAYLLLALRIGSPWMLVPIIAASVWLLAIVGPREVLRPWASWPTWVQALLAVGLIVPVLHLADFLIISKLYQGAAHQDALFHASITGLIKTYGLAAVGVHGVAEIPYHVLSHELLAAISVLSSVPALEVYGVAEIVVLGPLLLLALTWCTTSLADGSTPVGSAWLAACAVLVLLDLLPLEAGGNGNSYFISESYTVGLVYFLMALPLMASRASTLRDLALCALLLVVSGATKGSVGAIGMGLLAVRCVWWPVAGGRARGFVIIAVAALAFVWLMMGPAENATARMAWVPFNAAQTYGLWGRELSQAIAAVQAGSMPAATTLLPAVGAVAVFMLCHFLPSLAVVIGRWLGSGWRGLLSHPDAVLTLAAMGPALIATQIWMPGSWYFLNQAMFVSLPFVVWWIARWLDRGTAARTLLSAAAIAGAAFMVVDGYRHQPLGPVFQKHYRFVDRLNDRGRGGHIDALLALRPRYRDRLVVFEPDATFPKPADVWDCFNVPHTYPAVTERAWIGLVDPASKCRYEFYGYPQYFVPGTRTLRAPEIPPGVEIARVSSSGAVRPDE